MLALQPAFSGLYILICLHHLKYFTSYSSLLVEKWFQLNNLRNAACLFSPFSEYVMFIQVKIPGSPRFSILQIRESWVELGNKDRIISGSNL